MRLRLIHYKRKNKQYTKGQFIDEMSSRKDKLKIDQLTKNQQITHNIITLSIKSYVDIKTKFMDPKSDTSLIANLSKSSLESLIKMLFYSVFDSRDPRYNPFSFSQIICDKKTKHNFWINIGIPK